METFLEECLLSHNVTDTMTLYEYKEIMTLCEEHESLLGQDDNSWLFVISQILYGTICFLGLLSNLMLVCVIMKYSALKTITTIWILNLAVVQVFFALEIPLLIVTAVLGHWIFGMWLCKLYFVSTSISEITCPLIIIIMAADRFLATCHGSARKCRTRTKAIVISFLVWMLSGVLILPIFLYANILEIDDREVIICNIFFPDSENWSGEQVYMFYTTFFSFALPLLITLLIYILACSSKLSYSHRIAFSASTQQANDGESEKRNNVIAVAITVAYFLCWAPNRVTHMVLALSDDHAAQSGVVLYLVTGILAYSYSVVCPIICVYLSTGLKTHMKYFLSCAKSQSSTEAQHQEDAPLQIELLQRNLNEE